jgi:hypothetical protein
MENLLGELIGSTSSLQVPYCGGEFVSVSSRNVAELNSNIRALYAALMFSHGENTSLMFEEAHILSMAYSLLGWRIGSANPYVKRIWTQPLMFKNATLEDLKLLLIHAPAEKKYGVRRIYNRFFKNGDPSKYLGLSTTQHNNLISRQLGIPKNRARKWLFDVTYALWHKLLRRIGS